MVVTSSSGRSQSSTRFQIADRHRSFHHDGAIRLLLDALHVDIVLVGDFANDLLQYVLKRYQTFDFTILVDDDGDVRLLAQKGVQLKLQRRRVGHKPGFCSPLCGYRSWRGHCPCR